MMTQIVRVFPGRETMGARVERMRERRCETVPHFSVMEQPFFVSRVEPWMA